MEQNNEKNEQQAKNRQAIFGFIGIAILVIGIVGVTYAFFNYTRTGNANTIGTGRIAFSADQGDVVTLNNLFPITTVGEVTPETPGVGSVVVHVTGDTAYNEGVEYLVKAVNVTNTSGNAALPISINISYEATTGNNNTIGTADNNYYANRGGNTSLYKVLTTDTIAEGQELVVGYIAPGETGIDGNITIMAYLDASNIAITDTTPEGTVREVITTGYSSSACETALQGVTNASTYCATAASLQDAIDNENLTSAQIELLVTAGIVDEYTDGTTSNWVDGREVFTTEEWNALQSSGVSFQIKVEANEGVWVYKTIEGVATINPTSLNSASVEIIQGDLRYLSSFSKETSVETGEDGLYIGSASISRYNTSTSTYENITNSGEIGTVTLTLQHNNCNSGNPVTVVTHASGNYIDGLESLDITFVKCLIDNNQP